MKRDPEADISKPLRENARLFFEMVEQLRESSLGAVPQDDAKGISGSTRRDSTPAVAIMKACIIVIVAYVAFVALK